MAKQAWVAGHGTVSAALGILILHLAQDSELQNQLRNDPSLISTAIEEILRVDRAGEHLQGA